MMNEHVSGDSIIQRNKIIELTLTISALYFLHPISMLRVVFARPENDKSCWTFH